MTVVITGASRGFGAVMAQELMLRGYNVMCTARGEHGRVAYEELVSDAQKELEWRREGMQAKTGLEAEWVADLPDGLSHGFFPLDLDDDASIKEFCDYMQQNADQTMMYLINNAAVSHRGYTPENLTKCMNTNFWGTVKLTENLVPLMGPGSRIFQILCTGAQPRVGGVLPGGVCEEIRDLGIGSISDFFGNVTKKWGSDEVHRPELEGIDLAPYVVSKTILMMYTALRYDALKKKNIYLNGVCPGLMDTNLAMYPNTGRNPYYNSLLLTQFLEYETIPTPSAQQWYSKNRDYPHGRFLTSSTMFPIDQAIADGVAGGVKSSAFSDLHKDMQRGDWREKWVKERTGGSGMWAKMKGFFS